MMAGNISKKEKLKQRLEELQKKMALKERKLAEMKYKGQEQPSPKSSVSDSLTTCEPFGDKHLTQKEFHVDLNKNHLADPIIQVSPATYVVNNVDYDKTANGDQTIVKEEVNLENHISKNCKHSLLLSIPASTDNDIAQGKVNDIPNCTDDKKSPRASLTNTADVDFEDDIFQDNMTCIFANIATQDCTTVPSRSCNVSPSMKGESKIIDSCKTDVRGKSIKRSAEILYEGSCVKLSKKSTSKEALPEIYTEVVADIMENEIQKKIKLDLNPEPKALESYTKPLDPMFCDVVKNGSKRYDNVSSEDLSIPEDMFASQFQFSELQKSEPKDFSKLELNEILPSMDSKNPREEESGDNFNFIKTPAFIPLSKIAAKLEMESRDSSENSKTAIIGSKSERTENVFSDIDTKISPTLEFTAKESSKVSIRNKPNGMSHGFAPCSPLVHTDNVKNSDAKDHALRCTTDVKNADSEGSNHAQFSNMYLPTIPRDNDENDNFGEDAFLKTGNSFQIAELNQPVLAFESEANGQKLETLYQHFPTESQIMDYDQEHFNHNQLTSELEEGNGLPFELKEETSEKANIEDKQLPGLLPLETLESTEVKKKKTSSPRKKMFPVSAHKQSLILSNITGLHTSDKSKDISHKSKDLSDDDDEDDTHTYRHTIDQSCKECLKNGIAQKSSGASTSSFHQPCSSVAIEADVHLFSNVVIMEDAIEGFANDMPSVVYDVSRKYGDGTSSCFNYEVNYQNNDVTESRLPIFKFFLCRDLECTTMAIEKISISVYKQHAEVFCVFGQFVTVYERCQEEGDVWTPLYHHDFGDGITVKACLSLNDYVNMIFIAVLSSDDGLSLKFFSFTENCATPVPVLHNNFMEQRSKADEISMSEMGHFHFAIMAVSTTDSLVCAYELYDMPDEEKGREFYFVFKEHYRNSIPFTGIAKVHNSTNSILLLGENQLVLWNSEQADISYAFNLPEDVKIAISNMDHAYSENENLFVLFSFEDEFHHRVCRLMTFNFSSMNCQIIHNYNHFVAEAVVRKNLNAATMTAVDLLNGLIFVLCHGFCNVFDLMSGKQIKCFPCSDITAIACRYSILFLGLQQGGGQALYYTKGYN